MGEGILPTEELVEHRDVERTACGSLFLASCGSLGISASLGIGIVAHGWKGAAVTESSEGCCREVSHS